jgi:hypothetical protein
MGSPDGGTIYRKLIYFNPRAKRSATGAVISRIVPVTKGGVTAKSTAGAAFLARNSPVVLGKGPRKISDLPEKSIDRGEFEQYILRHSSLGISAPGF